MSAIKIITTSDGSHSLLNTALNETYHSIHGAIQESQHVFIQAGLDHWLRRNHKNEIRIFEVGFGTGLNAFLTLLHSSLSETKIYYESWEAFPLGMSTIRQLNYPLVLGSSALYSKIHESSWDDPVRITPTFSLNKRKGDILLDPFNEPASFDLVYYDAFAPMKQPAVWDVAILKKVADLLAPGGVWVTYCARGQVKRDLKSLTLTIETLPGPPGKKEMIRATKEVFL